MTRDLPLEIWYIILSYLPPGYVGRLFGVSRVLFDLAFDERYKEVLFCDVNPEMLRTFKRMQNPNISRRVRHFRIRPFFLPGAEDVERPNRAIESQLPLFKRRILFRFNPFALGKSVLRTMKQAYEEQKIAETLDVAKQSLLHCENLEELSIQIHDLVVTPSFHKFIAFIWPSSSANLRTLSLNVTFEKLVIVMGAIRKFNDILPRLEHLNLTFAQSRFKMRSSWLSLAKKNIVFFFATIKHTLKGLIITIPALITDLTFFFEDISKHLNHLATFKLHMGVDPAILFRFKSLAKFIKANQDSLEHLLIDDHDRQSFIEDTDELGLKSLKFPRLKELGFSLISSRQWPINPNVDSFAISNLVNTAPMLSSLVISNSLLSVDHFRDIIKEVSTLPLLQSLQLGMQFLTPHDIRLLAEKLPQLQRLQLRILFVDGGDFSNDRENSIGFAPALSLERNKHKEVFDNWNLRYLRVVVPSINCSEQETHPSIRVMETMALYIPRLKFLDTSTECLCSTSF